MKLAIYIAGPMKSDPDYQTKFNAAESYCTWKGWTVLNPAVLPEGLCRDAYMPICLAMVDAADAIVLLDGWQNSQGARIESEYAGYHGKMIFHGVETVTILEDDGK
jgi:nucleoside 2-deoxyribosyltransferase